MEEELKDKLNLGHNPLPVQFRRSHCKICFSHLHSSDEVDSFMKVVPMGVYYNISKIQPHWISLDPSACQTLNLVHRHTMCLKQPHMEAKHGQLLIHVLKATTHGGKACGSCKAKATTHGRQSTWETKHELPHIGS